MSRVDLLKDGLYKELPSTDKEFHATDGVSTFFRKFEQGVFIFQYEGNRQIGSVMLEQSQLDAIYNAKAIKKGDGKSPQE